jgi:hypothetical protein
VQLPVKFDPSARCPAWDKFISEVFPGDSEAIAWEIPATPMPSPRSNCSTVSTAATALTLAVRP